jgi:hypothetical protein
MIRRHWIQRFDELPLQSEHLFVLQSWDTANKVAPRIISQFAQLGSLPSTSAGTWSTFGANG